MTGFIRTVCPECGAENRVDVSFLAHNQGFETKQHTCRACGVSLVLTDPYDYSVYGTINNSQKIATAEARQPKDQHVKINMTRMNEAVINRRNRA